MIIEKSDLVGKLAKVKAAIPSKTTVAALQGILFEGDQIMANNLEIAITAKLPVETDEAFMLTQKAIDMIDGLPDGEVEIKPAEGRITILASGIKTVFVTHDPKEFAKPTPPGANVQNLAISSKKLHEMVTSVLYAAATNDARPTAAGVLFEAIEGEMSVVAVDGYRAAWNKTQVDGSFKFIVPRNSLEKILKLGMSGDIDIAYNDKNAVFASEKYTVYSRLISGEFLNYKTAFPSYANQIVVDRKALQGSVARTLICGDGTKKPAVFSFAGSKMTICAKTSLADYSEDVEIHGEADENLRIGFNATYLHDALKSYDAEHVTMSFGSATQPMVISDDELLSLLLPVRLNESNGGA